MEPLGAAGYVMIAAAAVLAILLGALAGRSPGCRDAFSCGPVFWLPWVILRKLYSLIRQPPGHRPSSAFLHC